MQYGHFDNQSREYVIDRVDLPVSWTNYIGVGDLYGVFNHTAGGYLLYEDGVIENDLYYEETSYQFFTSNFTPDGYACLRDRFLGPYRTERNPLAVETGVCEVPGQKGGNHCGVLQKNVTLAPGE